MSAFSKILESDPIKMLINVFVALSALGVIIASFFYSKGKKDGKTNAIQEINSETIREAEEIISTNEDRTNISADIIDQQLREFERKDD